MGVNKEKFKSEFGFESPSFAVTQTGAVTARTIDVETLLLNGRVFAQAQSEELEIPNSFDKLNVNGQFQVVVGGHNVLEVNEEAENLIIRSTTKGSIDNVDIGLETPGQATFNSVNIRSAGDSTISNIEFDNTTASGNLTVENNLVMTATKPTAKSHLTRKDYVDSKVTALAVAFGA